MGADVRQQDCQYRWGCGRPSTSSFSQIFSVLSSVKAVDQKRTSSSHVGLIFPSKQSCARYWQEERMYWWWRSWERNYGLYISCLPMAATGGWSGTSKVSLDTLRIHIRRELIAPDRFIFIVREERGGLRRRCRPVPPTMCGFRVCLMGGIILI